MGAILLSSLDEAVEQSSRPHWSGDPGLGCIAKHLPPDQQQLIALWRGGTVSTRALARVLDCGHGTLLRRLRAMQRRLTEPIALVIAQRGHRLSPVQRTVAVRRFLWGQPQTLIAHELGISRHEVRALVVEIRGWFAAQAHTK